MKHSEIQVKIEIDKREMQFWLEILEKKSCSDCQNFPNGVCKLAGDVLPPPEIQKTGCPEWAWDSIPF